MRGSLVLQLSEWKTRSSVKIIKKLGLGVCAFRIHDRKMPKRIIAPVKKGDLEFAIPA